MKQASASLGARSPAPSLRARAVMMVASVAVALLLAELGAGALHGFAFPFLNIFRKDARYGVLLQPDAHTRSRSRAGRVTRVDTNEAGFRGPAWVAATRDAPVAGRVLVLGDSQVFGYGVAYDESMAARLAERLTTTTGRGEVLVAAVPSWGPVEMVRALEDLGPVYRPSEVIFVANVANDWSEIGVPNVRRSSARDGWLIQRIEEQGAGEPTWFPGRAFLLGRSHLVLGVREVSAHLGRGMAPPADAATRLLRELPRLASSDDNHRSRMTRHVLEARRACLAVGARLTVVGLPMDLQVDPGEWAKYRSPPQDLRATEVLLDQLAADAEAHGIASVNLLGALRAASPGAFLPDDYHLSPKGHRAVAEAIAERLTAGLVRAERDDR